MTALVESPTVNGHSKQSKSPWWVCPSSRELLLRSEIKMGYSTIGSRIAKNRHSHLLGLNAIMISDKEIEVIKCVLARARESEKVDQLRSRSLIMEYEQLRASCRGNGEDNCIICGYDPVNNEKKLHLVTCDKCDKIACDMCYQMKKLLSGSSLTLCKLCFDYQELWCKTGAWMTNRLPKRIEVSEEEVEQYQQQERKGTRASIDLLGGIELQLDQDYLTPDEDEDSEGDGMRTETVSSYKNVKFFEVESNRSGSRSPTPMAMLNEITERTTPSPLPGRPGSELTRTRALSSDNRVKLSDIRDRVNQKVASSDRSRLNVSQGTSFDSLDSSEFEPLKIHESMEEKEEDMNIVISMPVLPEAPITPAVDEEESSKNESVLESEEEHVFSSDNSDFEYADIELPRSMSFHRSGPIRAPIRISSTLERKRSSLEKVKSIEGKEESEEEISQQKEEQGGGAMQDEPGKGIEQKQESLEESVTGNIGDCLLKKQEVVVTQTRLLTNEDSHSDEGESLLLDIPEENVTNIEGETVPDQTKTPQQYSADQMTMEGFPSPRSRMILESSSEGKREKETNVEELMDKDLRSIDSVTDIVVNPVPDKQLDDDQLSSGHSSSSSSTSSPRKSLKLQVIHREEKQPTEGEDQGSYRWRRRNATRSAVAGKGTVSVTTPTSSDMEGGMSMPPKDTSQLSKREKARLAARRVREGKVTSKSRRIQQDDEVVPIEQPRTRQIEYNDPNDQLI